MSTTGSSSTWRTRSESRRDSAALPRPGRRPAFLRHRPASRDPAPRGPHACSATRALHITAGGCAHHILIGHARETSLDKKAVKALHGKPVVVLPVQNEISQDSPAMDLLSVQMEARGGFHVLPIESTRAAMLDHGITPGEPFTDDQALSVARAVHADGVVISEYGDDAMKVRLLEAGQGGTIWQTRATVEMSAREFDDAAMMDVLASAAGKSLAGKKHIRIVKKTRMETRDSAGRIVMSVMWTILGLLLVVPLFAV